MMKFVGLEAVQAVISKMKSWIISKMFAWWKTLQISRVDGTKDQWEFSAEITNGTPKLYLRTTDWKYSKCTETVANNWFPFTCAPAQYANIKDGGKYQSYYFNSININPATGSLRTNGDITFNRLVINNGKDTEMIMGNGTVKDINTLSLSQEVPICTATIWQDLDQSGTPVCYGISDEMYETITSCNFFQTMYDGLVFRHMGETQRNGYPVFIAESISSLDTHQTLLMYFVDNIVGYDGSYCAIVAPADSTDIDGSQFTGQETVTGTYIEFDTL